MYIKKWILALCVALGSIGAQAQFDTHFTHYWALQGYYNPAVAGLSGRLNLYGTYAMQMAGYTNAPATMLVGADMVLPTEKRNQGTQRVRTFLVYLTRSLSRPTMVHSAKYQAARLLPVQLSASTSAR